MALSEGTADDIAWAAASGDLALLRVLMWCLTGSAGDFREQVRLPGFQHVFVPRTSRRSGFAVEHPLSFVRDHCRLHFDSVHSGSAGAVAQQPASPKLCGNFNSAAWAALLKIA